MTATRRPATEKPDARVRSPGGERDRLYLQAALRVTGAAFCILAAALLATSAVRLAGGQAPESTLWGIGVACARARGELACCGPPLRRLAGGAAQDMWKSTDS